MSAVPANKKRNYWYLLLSATVILSWVTIYNHYPIIYPDSGNYIESGMKLETPMDRPITYGIFIRLFSLNGLSLLPVVLIQNLILSFLLLETIISIVRKNVIIVFLSTVVGLGLFTGLSWVSNQIFADFFTPFIFLSAYLFVFSQLDPRKRKLILFIFILSVASHLSHVSIAICTLLIATTFGMLLIKEERKKLFLRSALLITLSLATVFVMGAAVSKSSAIFFTGKLAESGILKAFLDERCDIEHYKLCDHRNSIEPVAAFFIWGEKSTTGKLGGWKEANQEYQEICKAILTDPKFLKLVLAESAKSSIRQFGLISIGESTLGIYQDSKISGTLVKSFPKDLVIFESSRQARETLSYDAQNKIYTAVYWFSMFAVITLLLLSFLRLINLSESYILLVIVVLAGITANNILGASLANAIDRFGVRVAWLFTLLALLAPFAKKVKAKQPT